MNLTKEQLQNILAFLKIGKFNLNSDEATILAVLTQELNKGLSELNKPTEDSTTETK